MKSADSGSGSVWGPLGCDPIELEGSKHMKRAAFRLSFPILLIFVVMTSACSTGEQRNLASSAETAVFLPIITEYNVDLYVDRVDGEPTEFGLFDQVVVDAGSREIGVRLEYQPAAGTSLAVGGIGNLLLRASTNKTFRTNLSVDVISGHAYRLIARSHGDTLEIIIFDDTDDREVLKNVFGIKDGQFERLF